MKRLLVLLIILFTVLFTYTTIAQEIGAMKKVISINFPEKIQKLVQEPLPAGTYSVGAGGYFPTIDSAFNKLSIDGIAGAVNLTLIDTLYQAPIGHLFELVGSITGAGPNTRITIRPDLNTKVKIFGDSTAVLTFADVKFLTIDGHSDPSSSAEMIVHAFYNTTSDWNDCIDVWGDADFNQFLNLKLITDDIRSLGAGLVLINDGANRPDSNLVEGNQANGSMGILVAGATPSNTHPRGNIIRHNTIGSSSNFLCARGISSEFATGTIIEGNTVQFLYKSSFPDYTLGINAYCNLNTIIRNNVVHSLFGSSGARVNGIAVSGSSTNVGQGIQVYNNMVYDLHNTSIAGNGYIGGILVWYNSSVLIAYNSVKLEGTGTNPIGTDALGFDVGSTSVTINNNILVNKYHQTAGGGCTALWLDQAATFTTDFNDLYIDTSFANSSTVVHWNVGIYRTLINWQATGKDLNSVTEMPNFISPDLHIHDTIATYLESRATPIAGIESDYDGDTRNTNTPDIGADEFNGIPVGVEDEVTLPTEFALEQNYPNPFNPSTTIRYSIPTQSKVVIKVFDILGNEIATLMDEEKPVGIYELTWNAANLPSGVYFYQLKAGEYVNTKKMILLK